MYLCPNCKLKLYESPKIIKSGRYICPSCQSGIRIVPIPGRNINQTQEVNPLERWRRSGRHQEDEKELEKL